MTFREEPYWAQNPRQDGNPHVCISTAGPALQKLDPEIGFPRRFEILNEISDRLAEAGIETRTKHGPNLSLILAMTLNALMPEFECSFRRESNTKVVLPPRPETPYLMDPPDITLQQNIVRYLRNHKELHDSLIESVALTIALGDPYFQPGTPAIKLDYFGEFEVGSTRLGKIDDATGVVYIPGCGLAGLKMCIDLVTKNSTVQQAANVGFLLCDNHPFVAEVGTRVARYLAEPRITFLPQPMAEVEMPANITHVLLSYVEAAGRQELTQVVRSASQRNPMTLIAVAGAAPNEYSGLTSKDLRSIILNSGFTEEFHQNIPSHSTHFVREGSSVDFCDLTIPEAHQLIMTELPGGPPPNSETAVIKFNLLSLP